MIISKCFAYQTGNQKSLPHGFVFEDRAQVSFIDNYESFSFVGRVSIVCSIGYMGIDYATVCFAKKSYVDTANICFYFSVDLVIENSFQGVADTLHFMLYWSFQLLFFYLNYSISTWIAFFSYLLDKSP